MQWKKKKGREAPFPPSIYWGKPLGQSDKAARKGKKKVSVGLHSQGEKGGEKLNFVDAKEKRNSKFPCGLKKKAERRSLGRNEPRDREGYYHGLIE